MSRDIWNPRQYRAYSSERARPFFELLARVDVEAPAYVVDLGCGPGERTADLATRWPGAIIEGIDSSEQMISEARHMLRHPPGTDTHTPAHPSAEDAPGAAQGGGASGDGGQGGGGQGGGAWGGAVHGGGVPGGAQDDGLQDGPQGGGASGGGGLGGGDQNSGVWGGVVYGGGARGGAQGRGASGGGGQRGGDQGGAVHGGGGLGGAQDDGVQAGGAPDRVQGGGDLGGGVKSATRGGAAQGGGVQGGGVHGGGVLRFSVGDLAEWAPDRPVDVIFSNAALQWVPEHRRLLSPWVEGLAPGGRLAFSMPGNFEGPSHVLLRELCESPRWGDRLGAVNRHNVVGDPADYFELLSDLGCDVDAWETTYLQVLHGPDPVLAWMKGTALRPALDVLTDEREREEFLGELAVSLRHAYPPGRHGTVFPFRRVFVVARPKASSPRSS